MIVPICAESAVKPSQLTNQLSINYSSSQAVSLCVQLLRDHRRWQVHSYLHYFCLRRTDRYIAILQKMSSLQISGCFQCWPIRLHS